MSQEVFQIFHKLFGLAAELFYAAELTGFILPFLTKRRRWIFVFGAYFAVWLLCSNISVLQGSFGFMLLFILTAISKGLGLERPQAFLLTLLYCNVRISSGLIMESLYFVIEQLFPVWPKLPKAIYLRTAIWTAVIILSHAFLLLGLLYVLQRQMRKRPLVFHKRELCYMSLIPAAGILFGQIISRLFFEVKDGELLQLYDRYPIFLGLVPLLALLFYLGAFFTVMFQQGMAALQEERTLYVAKQQQMQWMEERICEAEQWYVCLRQMKHDMRNHLANIRGLTHTGQYANLEKYIACMGESIGNFPQVFSTGNIVTDVIISDKCRQCQEQGIDFQVDFLYPAAGQYEAYDLGIILYNLLQNALEACEKIEEGERYIFLTGKQTGHFFLLCIENSFDGEVSFGRNGLPLTTKTENISMHGIGLSNVRKEADKYMGELELKTDWHKFSATVLLQERSSL